MEKSPAGIQARISEEILAGVSEEIPRNVLEVTLEEFLEKKNLRVTSVGILIHIILIGSIPAEIHGTIAAEILKRTISGEFPP